MLYKREVLKNAYAMSRGPVRCRVDDCRSYNNKEQRVSTDNGLGFLADNQEWDQNVTIGSVNGSWSYSKQPLCQQQQHQGLSTARQRTKTNNQGSHKQKKSSEKGL
jgi:hypothetical protein